MRLLTRLKNLISHKDVNPWPTVIGDTQHNYIHSDAPTIYTPEEYDRIARRSKRFFSTLPNPVVPDMADIQPWFYYDRAVVAAATATPSTILFFSSPMSGTKTKLDTNLQQAGRLPDPKHFLCTSIRFIPLPNMAAADIIAMIANYWVEFFIGDKTFAEGHIDLYPGGAGLYGATATTGVTNSFTDNGYPNPMAVNDWGLDRALHILQGQSFGVKLISPAPPTMTAGPGTGLNLRCVLDGVLFREVQ